MNLNTHPKDGRMRRLIYCADGTWNSPDQELDTYDLRKPSNVVKLSRAILPISPNGTSQVVFYDTGVGTHNFVDKLVGGATGAGLSDNIIQGYRFLASNYHPGDEIYLFGFSRGAYTVRSLAALIANIGLLPNHQEYWLPEGYELYRSQATRKQFREYRVLNKSRTPSIRMVGVWDTVGALGIPVGILSAIGQRKFQFHDVSLPTAVEHAYHALAIDETRIDFAPSIWNRKLTTQTVEQAWFPGVHTNIGGGYADNGLANHALHWMVSKADILGLAFDYDYLTHYEPDHLGTIYRSRKGFYRLKQPHIRAIGLGVEETLHESVKLREYDDARYKPSNVAKYRSRGDA